MADWLHFIGRKYYPTPEHFAVEAARFGVTRRISRPQIKSLAFGDVVHVAMIGDKGRAEVFGSFTVTRVSGLSRAEMIKLLIEHEAECRLPDDDSPDESELVERGCGEYLAAPAIVVDMPLDELLEAINGVSLDDKGTLMVSGALTLYENVGVLRDVKQRQGFRRFDYRAFSFARDRLIENGYPATVAGNFYANPEEPGRDGGEVQAVGNYRRTETIESDKKEAIKERERTRQGRLDFGG